MNPSTSSIEDLNQPIEAAITIPQQSSKTEEVVIQIQKIENCPVCLDEYASDQMITLPLCQHSFCSECLKEYLEDRIQNLQVLKIPCPQSECKELLEDSTLKMILEDEQYIKYRETVLKKIVNRDLEHKFCPKPGCAKSIKLLLEDGEYTTCSCGTQVCNVCSNFWHEGKTCLEALDIGFELFSKENDIRFCMLCKTTVKREEGCLHITCPVCDYDWCWVCGREFASHQCAGYWSPMPPGSFPPRPRYKFDPLGKFSRKQRILIIASLILFSPIILAVLLLIWPIVTFPCFKDLTWNKPIKSICLILCSISIGVLFLPITLPYTAIVLAGLLFMTLIMLLLTLIKCLCSLCPRSRPAPAPTVAPPTRGKRWKTGDVNQFGYTNKAQVPANPGVPAQAAEEPLGQADAL